MCRMARIKSTYGWRILAFASVRDKDDAFFLAFNVEKCYNIIKVPDVKTPSLRLGM